MLHNQTFIRCSRRSASLILATIAALFVLVGCAALFRAAGYNAGPAQHEADQVRADLAAATAAAVTDITSGIAQGQDFKAIAAQASSALIWKLATIAASTIGTVLTALLAKWLGTERKITKAIIKGVEDHHPNCLKESIQAFATTAGIEPQLNARVKALT